MKSYKVIKYYPDSPHPVGTIIKTPDGAPFYDKWPDIFEPIPDTPEPEQTTKEGFAWDDDLVQDFFSMLPRYFSQGHSTNSAMNKFKASKPSQSNTPKEEPPPSSNTDKERVLDIQYLQEDNNAVHHYSFTCTKWVAKETIKKVIEAVLNDDARQYWDTLDKVSGSKLYTQSDLNKAIEDAFRAGKMFTWAQSNMGEPDRMKWIYETPEDYLKTINK